MTTNYLRNDLDTHVMKEAVIRREAEQKAGALYRARIEELVQRHDDERSLRVGLQRRLEAFLPKAEYDWLSSP